ncbi:1,4-dihydroxy-2-naphthoate polyprenyltransferase [Lactococcus cremoris]
MSLKSFLELVEIKTKIASIFPYLIGILFSISYFKILNLGLSLLFLVAMLLFDMTVTAINNYQDYKKAKDENYKKQENIIGQANLSTNLVAFIILLMLALSLILGFSLAYFVGWLFFLLGGIVFFIGVFYTYGPIPLSRMPLGEIFSGGTMGFGIFAMVILINTSQDPIFSLNLDFTNNTFSLNGSIFAAIAMIIASLPLIFTIANIMLANNLRDLDTDIKNHRYTLVYYIGRPYGIKLFQILMYASSCYYPWLLFRIFEWPTLLAVTFPILKNLKAHEHQDKSAKFCLLLKKHVLFNSAYAFSLLLSIIWQYLTK